MTIDDAIPHLFTDDELHAFAGALMARSRRGPRSVRPRRLLSIRARTHRPRWPMALSPDHYRRRRRRRANLPAVFEAHTTDCFVGLCVMADVALGDWRWAPIAHLDVAHCTDIRAALRRLEASGWVEVRGELVRPALWRIGR